MRILIIGGTVFLGRALVAAARDKGHDVTIFHRGEHPGALPTGVTEILGDRANDLDRLQGQHWDAVIDTCGYFPRIVRLSAEALREVAPHYTFISTISVYGEDPPPYAAETTPVVTLDDPTVEEVTGETYGALKALCEQAARDVYGDQALIIRPGLIVGPYDPSDRFTYWPRRFAQGGEVLAPGNPQAQVEYVDVRDLAAFILHMAEQRASGVYNATGPATPQTMAEFLDIIRATINPAAVLEWVDEAFLLAQGVEPWMGLPLWLDTPHASINQANCAKALAAGLTFRPLAETARDTLSWDVTRPPDTPHRAGISLDRERDVLAAWRQRETSA